MQIAIIGTGNVGGSLGQALSAKGHQIVYGVRDPNSPKTEAIKSTLGAATVTSIAEAVAANEVIFLTVPGNAVAETLENAGDLTGKTLVDCTNRTDKLPTPGQSSLEATASSAPGAHVVKCFNTMAADTYLKPKFGNSTATAFYCGDNAEAKNTLKQLGEDMGFEMHDLGAQSNGYLMDAIFQTWVALAFGQKLGRRLGFKILTAHDDQV